MDAEDLVVPENEVLQGQPHQVVRAEAAEGGADIA